MHRFVLFFSALTIATAAADSPAADRIEKEFRLKSEQWSLKMRIADTPQQREKLLAERPDPNEYAARMWNQIGDHLKEDWTIAPASWFLRLTKGLRTQGADGVVRPAFTKETEAIFNAIGTYHLNSPKLTPACLALANTGDPRALALLEKIEAKHPVQEVQGVAALSTALVLKSLGDNEELMKKRITLIRKAIIQSAHVEVLGTTIAKIAEDELYIIRFLSKDRVAPDLVGKDSANRPLSLSSYQGKVVVLLFWNSSMNEAQHTLEVASELEKKFQGRPFALLGVHQDSVEKLRSLQADNTVTWTNFSDPEGQLATEYRASYLPLAYVLDQERKIQYVGNLDSFVELSCEALLSATPAASGQ